MKQSERFWSLIDSRRSAGEQEKAQIDATLWREFGRTRAIVFTDLSGFTRTTSKHGIESFLEVIRSSHLLFEPVIAAHGGMVLKYEGDSLLVTFDSVEAALSATDEMFLAADRFNATVAMERQVHLCVGVGFGQALIFDGHDIFGLEVNLASRLGEDTARPGEVLMTSDAVDGTKDSSLKSRIVAISDEPGDAVSMWSFRPKRSQAI